MAIKKAAKPARRKTAKKQQGVRKLSKQDREIQRLLGKQTKKSRRPKKFDVKAALDAAGVPWIPLRGRIRPGNKRLHTRHSHQLPTLPPRNFPKVVPEVPTRLELQSDIGVSLVRTGTMTREQANRRMHHWNSVYPKATILVV